MKKGGQEVLIGICDDKRLFREGLKEFCEIYFSNIPAVEVICFSSGEEVLAYNEPIDILLLDIYMEGIDGMQTARKIREKDEVMIIIFITCCHNYIKEGYYVNAFRYILKPVKEEEFIKAMNDAIKELTKNDKIEINYIGGGSSYVRLRDILYVEYTNRTTIVRTKCSTYETRLSLKEWEGVLDNGEFFRAHKAYIVNLSYIKEISTDILMENGEKVEVSTRQMAKLKKECSEHIRRNGR